MAAKKKIWSVYEKGARYEGPLTEVEASSEKNALDTAAFVYGFEGPSRKKLYALPGAYFSRTMHAKKGVKSAPERTTTAVEYHAHTGRPSWHQARAGGISSGVGVYSTREAAETYCTNYKKHHPDEPCFIIEKKI